MLMSENLGTFSLFGEHRTSFCLPLKPYMGMPEAKRKPVVATQRQFFVRQILACSLGGV
jgi:hypothetical protein